jgi:hypothetical protein
MDPMSEHLARTIIDARLAEAYQRRLLRRIEAEELAERRMKRRLVLARWRQRLAAAGATGGATRTLAMAGPAAPDSPPSAELASRLDAAAHRIAESGTASERRLIEAMSDVVQATAPGTAAALVDREGSEVARLRAFGLAHSHLVNVLGFREHAWLLDLLDGGRRDRSGLVA